MASQHRWSIGRSGLPVWGTLVMVCVGALPMVSDQEEPARVVVVSVSGGDWTPVCQAAMGDCKAAGEPRRPVRWGETLTAGAICVYGPEQGSIVLKSSLPTPEQGSNKPSQLADDTLYPFQCQKEDVGKKKTCEKPRPEACALDLRTLRNGLHATFFDTISDAFKRMMHSQSDKYEKYMVAASRGAEPELVDAVVPIEDSQIDVQAVFREMDPGTYYVELAMVGAPPLGPPSRVSFAKGQAARLEARGVRAGLYRLALVTEKGEPGVSDCWILAAAPPEYAKQASAYGLAVRESTKLPKEMDEGATRALLRAYLESLAKPIQGKAVRP